MQRSTRLVAIGIIAVAGAVYLFASGADLETQLQKDIEAIAAGSPPATLTIFNDYDLICFDAASGTAHRDFLLAASRLNSRFTKSLDACGLDRSCCNLDSEAGGVIGLVKGAEIRCETVYRFGFVRKNVGTCSAPKDVHVRRLTLPAGTHIPGRPYVATPNVPFYEIFQPDRGNQ